MTMFISLTMVVMVMVIMTMIIMMIIEIRMLIILFTGRMMQMIDSVLHFLCSAETEGQRLDVPCSFTTRPDVATVFIAKAEN